MPPFDRRAVALVATVLVAACQFVPPQLRGNDLIVMEVKNGAPRPLALVVATMSDESEVVGSAEPAVVPAGQTMMVNFFVPRSGEWAIWANGGQLMGEPDLRGRRGTVPMGIEVDSNGGLRWWCQGDCP